MRPIEGGIYCRICTEELRKQIEEEALSAVRAAPGMKGTCWGCGATVELRETSTVIREEADKYVSRCHGYRVYHHDNDDMFNRKEYYECLKCYKPCEIVPKRKKPGRARV